MARKSRRTSKTSTRAVKRDEPTLTSVFQDIADSIRENGVEGTMTPTQMAGKIRDISTSSGDIHLKGKTIWTFGDSIAYGKGNRNTENTDGGWSRILSEDYGATCVNYGLDGAILSSKTNTEGNIITQVNNHKTDATKPDIILLEGGVNDCWRKNALGVISSGYSATLDTTTVLGALESICKTVSIDYAPARTIFIFTHNGVNVDDNTVAGGKWADDFKPKMKEVLVKWGIPYLDLSTVNPEIGNHGIDASLKTKYLIDNCHPNELGYKTLYVPYIIGGIHTFNTLDNGSVSSSSSSNDNEICNIVEEQWSVTLGGDVGTYTASNTRTYVGKNQTYYNTIELGEDLVLNSITVTMGGTNITSTCVSNDVIEIETVTGNVVVNVSTNSTKHAVTRNLGDHLTSTNTLDEVGAGQYTTTIKPNTGYRVDAITVTMDGVDITSSVLTGNSINIPSVSGVVVITATELVGACEYITVSNTSSVIDSGVEFTEDLKIEAKYQYGGSGSSSDKGVCGMWIDNYQSVFLAANMQRFGGTYKEVTVDTNIHTASTALNELIYDGVQHTSVSKAGDGHFTASTNHLFIAGMKADQYWGGKIWYVKVWKNGELVRHYVPASETTLVDIVNQ